jgi:DNA-binding transcriptional MerR regulator
MAKSIEQRQQDLQRKKERLQTIIDMRAQGMTWSAIAAAMNLNNHQRAVQLHQEALAEGLTPSPETA